MSTLTASSPGKINLTLRVIGTRPGGFHEIESLVTRVDLCDEVSVRTQDDGTYSLDCDDPALPRDGSNLVLQAARALARAADLNRGVHIKLTKRIPAGSGLGGGSSNAATTLRLLHKLWGLGFDDAKLTQIGAELGSDVPLFLHGPLVVLRSRGEQAEDVPQRLNAWATLLLPDLHCATPAVYAAWDRMTARPEWPSLAEILAKLSSPEHLTDLLFNDLEPAAFAVVPALRELARRAAEIAGGAVRMTGAGAALFRLFGDESSAHRFARRVEQTLKVRTAVASSVVLH
jgi:4-diphosphocytidyl-2-C-methyl-D-erythritol kinase